MKMLAAKGTTNGGDELTCNPGFHDIPERPRRKAPIHEIGVAVNAQENNTRRTAQLPQAVHSFNSIKNRHGYIRDDEVRFQTDGLFDQRLPVANFADNLELWFQEACLHLRETWVIIRQ